jgi:hypothetical protein
MNSDLGGFSGMYQKTKRILGSVARSMTILSLVTFQSACNQSAQKNDTTANETKGFVKIRLEFGSNSAQLADSLNVEFLGLGVFQKGKSVFADALSGGSADILLPLGEIELRGTLVSSVKSESQFALLSRTTQKINISPDTTSISLDFQAYQKEELLSLVGVLYENNSLPAANLGLNLLDPHSGAAVSLPGNAALITTDSRGVYSFKYFASATEVRMRPAGNNQNKDFLLPARNQIEPGWKSLGFLNLNGTDQNSPFEINRSLLKGDKGDKGDNGNAGSSGESAKVTQVAEAPGSNCPSGGTKISSWTQSAGTDSVTFSPALGSKNLVVSYVCNAASTSSNAKLYQGSNEAGFFVAGVKPFLKMDNAFFSLTEGSAPGTVRSAEPGALFYETGNCSGTAYTNSNTGIAVTLDTGYRTASTIGAALMQKSIFSLLKLSPAGNSMICKSLGEPGFQILNIGNSIVNITNFGASKTSDGSNFSSAVISNVPILTPPAVADSTTNSLGKTIVYSPYGYVEAQRTSDNGASFTSLQGVPYGTEYFSQGSKFFRQAYSSIFGSSDNGATWTEIPNALNGVSTPKRSGDKLFLNTPQRWLDLNNETVLSQHYPCDRFRSWKKASKMRCLSYTEIYETVDAENFVWKKIAANVSQPFSGIVSFGTISSDSGQFVIYTDSTGALKFSSDWGDTWTNLNLPSQVSVVQDVDISVDGSKIALTGSTGGGSPKIMMISSNNGASWTTLFTQDAGESLEGGSFTSSGDFVAIKHISGILNIKKWSNGNLSSFPWTAGFLPQSVNRCTTGKLCLSSASEIRAVAESDLSTEISGQIFISEFLSENVPIPMARRDFYNTGSHTIFQSGGRFFIYDGTSTLVKLNGNSGGQFPLSTFSNQSTAVLTSAYAYLTVDNNQGGGYVKLSGTVGQRLFSPGQLFPFYWVQGSSVLLKSYGNDFIRSTDGGRTFANYTLPSDVNAPSSSFTLKEGLLIADDSFKISMDAGGTWTSSGIPAGAGRSISKVMNTGSTWFVLVNVSGAQSELYRSVTGNSAYAIVNFPEAMGVVPTRPVVLPPNVNFPLGELKFNP